MGLIDKTNSVLLPEGNLVGGEQDGIERPWWVIIYTWFSLAEDGDILESYPKLTESSLTMDTSSLHSHTIFGR